MRALFFSWITALVCIMGCSAALAMTVEVHGNQVFATGPVDDDLKKFEEAFAKPGVDTVVFVNSPGGDLWTGLRVGRLIADKGLKTIAAGSCVSACSIMFMGGKERLFADAFRPNQTYIGIHGAHDKETKRINPIVQPQIFAFYKQHMGEKFNATVMNQALYDMDDAGSLLVVFDPVRNSKRPPYHCKSSQTPRDKCSKIENFDALSLGILTRSELVKLNLPTAFALSLKLLGKDLTIQFPDFEAQLAAFAEERCPDAFCKTGFASRAKAYANHKALAVPSEGKGFGASWNSDTPTNAFVRAVYQCNHRKNYPALLCDTVSVNEYDVRSFYAEDEQKHAEALTSLRPTKDRYYANEEFGGGFTSFQSLRTEKLSDTTPQKLPDIKTVSTQDLSTALHNKQGWQLIDVAGGLETLPSSKLLLFGGFASEDKSKDDAFKERFTNLLTLLAPDKSAPVVFFCANRNCWSAVNAAVRAKQLGYSHVMWYRGGLESWKAAELPIAPNILRAVAN
jgi:rhodanese-related sulfurtransferase